MSKLTRKLQREKFKEQGGYDGRYSTKVQNRKDTSEKYKLWREYELDFDDEDAEELGEDDWPVISEEE